MNRIPAFRVKVHFKDERNPRFLHHDRRQGIVGTDPKGDVFDTREEALREIKEATSHWGNEAEIEVEEFDHTPALMARLLRLEEESHALRVRLGLAEPLNE